MIVLLLLFFSLCAGTIMIQRIRIFQSIGLRLNLLLIMFSLGMFALWFWMNAYWPPVSIPDHWRMVSISLAGFLSMLFSVVSSVRDFKGVQSGITAAVSFAIGAIHFVFLIASIPVS